MPLTQWLSSDNKGATGSSFFCIKYGLYLGKYHLTTFTLETSLSPEELLLLTLEPLWANCHKLINRLTDPVTKVDKSSSKQTTPSSAKLTYGPSSLPRPSPPGGSSSAIDLSLPVKPFVGCFICVRVHRYPTCIPSFCKMDPADRHQRQLYRKPQSD